MIAFIVFALKCGKNYVLLCYGLGDKQHTVEMLSSASLMWNEDFASVLIPDLGGSLLYTSGYDN